MSDVVIAGYVRSPFHPAYRGALAKVRPDDLAANTIKGLIERTGVNAEDIEDVLMGCAFPEGEQGFNIARLVVLLADLPLSIGGMTLNRFCGSSMSAVHYAAGQIAMGAGEVFIAAGVESMSRVPMTGFNPMPNPELAKRSAAYIGMGDTAENVAKKYELSREAQEAFALKSQQKAGEAVKKGSFKDEIVPYTLPDGTVIDTDGTPRPETTAEGLAGLKLSFDENGTVTAGTASPLTDGSAALLVCSADYAAKNGLKVMAKVKSMAISGCAPEIMGIGPVGIIQKSTEACRPDHGRYRCDRTQRSLLQPVPGQHRRPWHRQIEDQPRWRRDCHRPSAGCHRCAHRRQGGQPAASAKARNMLSSPSASVADRASQPCWRPYNG